MNDKEMEFIWRPSSSLGNDTQIFTHVLMEHYCAPTGMDWDLKGATDPWISNKDSMDYNAPKIA